MRVAAFGNNHAPPTERLELRHRPVLEGDRLHPGRERRVKPEYEALVDNCVDSSGAKRGHTALVARPAVELQAATPGFEIGQSEAINCQRLVQQYASGMRRIFP